MIWQDLVLTIVSIIFTISLVPQVYAGFKEKAGYIKHLTSIPTFLGLYVICVIYFTLHLYFAAATAFITGTLWLFLFIQRLIYPKK